MPSRPASSDRSIRLALPATSANLGPAFDTAALAMDFYLRLRAERAPDFFITAEGRDAQICRRMDDHLILTTYREVLESENRKVVPLSMHIENEIPIGKGCGSSAAARLAGIALAVHYGHLRWKADRIVGEASMREHHPDNASACWMGGITVARMANQVQAQIVEVKPKGRWPLLLASFVYDRTDLLPSALEDRIHQPYRAPLCPLLPAIKELTGESGILGAALSGAGPSVLVFLDPKANPKRAKQRIAAHLAKRRLPAELVPTQIASHGGRDGVDWRRSTGRSSAS